MKVKWFPGRALETSRDGAVEALVRGSEYLLEKANETVPVQEGILKGSGSTDVNEADLVATVFYNTPYAARQHEEVTLSHPHGRAKWLELTFQEERVKVQQIMRDALGRHMP